MLYTTCVRCTTTPVFVTCNARTQTVLHIRCAINAYPKLCQFSAVQCTNTNTNTNTNTLIQSPDHSIIQPLNHSITQSLNHSITHLLIRSFNCTQTPKQAGLKIMGVDMPIAEIECVLANLIFQVDGWMDGWMLVWVCVCV